VFKDGVLMKRDRLMVGAVSILKNATVAYFIHLERLRIGPPTAGPVPCGEIFRAPSNGRSVKIFTSNRKDRLSVAE
jgi:hypothetical protein